MSNQGEFIYSSHLWGGILGLNKQASHTSNTSAQVPKLNKERKVSEHTWDHEEPLLKTRKFSVEDDLMAANFSPFDSMI